MWQRTNPLSDMPLVPSQSPEGDREGRGREGGGIGRGGGGEGGKGREVEGRGSGTLHSKLAGVVLAAHH